jgi:hypothetical protein
VHSYCMGKNRLPSTENFACALNIVDLPPALHNLYIMKLVSDREIESTDGIF